MTDYIESLQNLAEKFGSLQGVGRKTAMRMAFSVIELDAEAVGQLTSFGDQLQADSGDLPLLLLDEDPHISNISHSSHPKV